MPALLFLALGAQAGVVDVTSSQTILMNSGDTLSFELFAGSYRAVAQQFGLPATPAALVFALVTDPVESGPRFSATLRVTGASKSVALDSPLDFASGSYSSTGFQGAVSTLQGQFHIDSLSQDLFQSGPLWLDITNLGENLTIGLASLTLPHDLYGSFSNGPLSVGAVNGSVLLRQGSQRFASTPMIPRVQPAGFELPEPGPGSMILGGAGLLALAKLFQRWSQARR